MVYAFVIQNVATKDDNSVIIYSEAFGAGMYLDLPADKQRKLREDHLQHIAARVNSEYRFKKACNIESVLDAFNLDRPAETIESGVFRLPVGKPLPSEKHVLWQVNASCGFTMVLSPEENKALAENILNIIIQNIGQIFKSFDHCNEVCYLTTVMRYVI